MPPVADIADILQIVVMLGGGVFFLARLGGKMDRLTAAIDRLDSHLRDHENRIRVLERRPPLPTSTTVQRSS